MTDFASLNDRLDALENRIVAARDRLQHDPVYKDHATTLDEMTERYLGLQQQLAGETVDLAAQGVHIDSFEKTVLTWINGLTHG